MENKKLYQNIQQVFILCSLLQRPRTVKELQRELKSSQRQVYRYLDVLRKIHYPVVKDKTRYYLGNASTHAIEHSPLPESKNFNEKLPSAHQISLLHETSKQFLLDQAIKQKKVVKLLKYQSPQDGILDERSVEPLYICENSERLQCYCRTEQMQRQYKIIRIGELEKTEEGFTTKYTPQSIDAFGLSGITWLPVRMRLHKRAYHLMWEEFVGARRHLLEDKNGWYYDGQVLSYYGIGRFVLGLPGDISEVEPVEFREFLQMRIQAFVFEDK